MNKILVYILVFSVVLSSCSTQPHWTFGSGFNTLVYYESGWNCFYEKMDKNFYVECYEKETGDIDSFYTTRVQYEK